MDHPDRSDGSGPWVILYVSQVGTRARPHLLPSLLADALLTTTPQREAYYRLERLPQSSCIEAQQVGDVI